MSKSGLSYISEYGDGENTDSEEDEYDHQKEDCVRLTLPRPNLGGVSVVQFEEHIDDSGLHGGRVRSFPHIRGNWPSYVYIEYPHIENLSKVIFTLTSLVKSIDDSFLKCDDIHISLSKTFALKYHMINTFTSSIQEVFNNLESFELSFESVDVYCNEEKTRTFIALKVDFYASRYLLDITKKIDKLLEEFRLPKFYHDPSFHMSVLSVNGNKKEQILNILGQLNEQFFHQDERVLGTVIINKVNCKIGNKYYQYYLK